MPNDTAAALAVATKPSGFSLVPQTFAEFEKCAQWLSESSLVPKDLRGKPGDVMIAMEKLHQLGLNPIADLDSVAVINGKASIHSEKWIALVVTAPGYLGCDEEWNAALDGGTAIVTYHRLVAGAPKSSTKTFSLNEAKVAGLMGKDTWKNYPKDMAFWRARHRAGAVLYADRTQGIVPAAVIDDYATERAPAIAEFIPERKSEHVPVVEAEPVPEPHAPAQAAEPAGESFVLSGVVLEKEGRGWKLWRLECVEGGPFHTKEADLADFAQGLIGKAVRIKFEPRAKDMREALSLTPIEG